MQSGVCDIRDALTAWSETAGAHPPTAEATESLLDLAERLLGSDPAADPDSTAWHDYLDATGRPGFFERLPDRMARERWAATAFHAIRRSGYSLQTMMERRVADHPDRVLFEDVREADIPTWTYAQVAWYARAIAGVFLGARPSGPRVAILSENSIDSACTDLACLLHGILVTPLNVHFHVETLSWIFDRLDINLVVTDSDEHVERLADVRSRTGRDLVVFRSGDRAPTASVRGLDVTPLRHACAQVDLEATQAQLAARPIDITAPATVMFTSGSTGRPKGVIFSQYNLVSKRFARAAALPSVGRDEVLLCYLPLFHTFGRFLEMLGTIYWGGTYVFAGNPSADALIAQLGRVRPTGLISIPVRWTQIRQACLDAMDRETDAAAEAAAFREIVGDRLRWGLSAAGFLDPTVFRFFQRHGVDLCSGFGMTEATGGITMTPPRAYVDGTVGIPLPGIRTRLGAHQELQISGPYVARYLDEDAPAGSLPSLDPDEDHWIATGDLFTEHADGYLEIVDRIKDIYKNSRGQTVAPQRVEQRFTDVPGIRRTFLAGDHRDHNVLLVVPNREDPVLASRSDEEVRQYLGQIVASVNVELAPYERVVNFALVDRDFTLEEGELTPKGTLRRKVIEEHFRTVIDDLYRGTHVELPVDGLRVRIPRWFFRDLAGLEDDIVAEARGLFNTRSGRRLTIARGSDGWTRVGDLQYQLPESVVDLGLFSRQPRLWVGNPSLMAFSPCKPGWDVPLRGVSGRVRLPEEPVEVGPSHGAIRVTGDEPLREIHRASVPALFGSAAEAAAAVERLEAELARADARSGSVIRRRLEALASRPEEAIRARAYRILLLDEPAIDYDKVFPTFLESGLTFLDQASIAAIASARHGEHRLQGLRQRLHSYRTRLEWPGPAARRIQFQTVFQLLADFARHHRDYFPAVESELACWALFGEDRALARAAERQLDELNGWYEDTLASGVTIPTGEDASRRVVFDLGIPAAERRRLARILFDRTFIRRALANAFGEEFFDWGRVAPDGAWVSPMLSHAPLRLYRLGLNLVDGKHFDLLLVVGSSLRARAVKDTVLWQTALSGHAFGTPALPRMGAWRKDLGAIAVAYVSDLTAWDRIRELSRQQDVRDGVSKRWAFRKLLVRAMAAFFHAWDHSGRRIVPGPLTPTNVAVPDADFHEGTSILSLAGWRPYDGPLSIVAPLVRNFYQLTAAHYPQTRDTLQLGWIFDACLEALGPDEGGAFLDRLGTALSESPLESEHDAAVAALAAYRQGLQERPYVPLPGLCAIHRFLEWQRVNPTASQEAREEAVIQMLHLYRLARFHEAFRYHVYQHTYFARSGDAIRETFDQIVLRALRTPGSHRGHLEELSALQRLIADPVDRGVFSRMVFPYARKAQKLELFEVGQPEHKRVLVRSEVRDVAGTPYVVREPVTPVEIGQLYRLILETDYPMHITEQDRHLVVAETEERVVGGLRYRWQEAEAVYVDGIVIAAALVNRGLGGRLLEDFCVRMAAQGARCVKTNYFLGQLFSKHGFHVNQRWGGLVRFLTAPEE